LSSYLNPYFSSCQDGPNEGLAPPYTEADFLDEIQTTVLRVFLIAIHSHLYSFALRFLFLQTHTTYYTVLYTVKEKGGKPDRKPYPLPYGLRLFPEISKNFTFMNSAFADVSLKYREFSLDFY
jgi:hypothetical protein